MSLPRNPAFFTCDLDHGPNYYFWPANRTKPPYLKQIEVKAILDIASDGTLAGVELIWGPIRRRVMKPLPMPPQGSKVGKPKRRRRKPLNPAIREASA